MVRQRGSTLIEVLVTVVLLAFGLLGVAVAPSPELAIAAWVPFGIGMGLFLSADWALMADVIPKETAGRFMGILNAGTAMAVMFPDNEVAHKSVARYIATMKSVIEQVADSGDWGRFA